MSDTKELIAALEAAPEGTRELGVAVLEAVGATVLRDKSVWPAWFLKGRFIHYTGDEARVVTDLSFRLPGVPEGWWEIKGEVGFWTAGLFPRGAENCAIGTARTERLARCIAELQAVLATKEKT